MALETSAEAPVPVRAVLQLVGGWIGKLGRVWVEGQIAECTKRGGTAFITLRDPVAAVSVQVICSRPVFEGASPQVGARVVVWAKPDFNANRGSFALTALEIRAVGIGELLARLERLRRQLTAEGLFSAERKRPLPFLPGVIGLICGRDSAAQRDVQQNAERRWPAVRFRVEQTAVQGPFAVGEITEALRGLDEDPEVDVIVIARGGGSLEDLLPFSDEGLIRAVAACRTPVVSAIGHEQDTPLLDYVADLRASTPTDAAKRIVPDVTEQLKYVTDLRDRAHRSVKGWLDRELAWLESVRSRPAIADPVREVERQAEQAGALTQRARMSLDSSLARAGDDIAHVRARLLALSPAATLRRGYAIVQHADATVVRAAAEVTAGEKLTVRFAADQVTVHADGGTAE
ncbi:MAG: exodeoxyribonuclease VII large subunit [Streptosporangiaceae bacterium]|nr:exodeoxyribonuclease VII large subunit [Streptosporangiaceae bacterium]MBV9853227.1 exodeoxyribonuclease VII large subunit [Streptosporangiaceae bacterium]